jgi:hypothetical protein
MPQACDEQRALMGKWFGNKVADEGPLQFLYARGWEIDRNGTLVPPTPAHQPSPYEFACVCFLCEEWDYGYNGSMTLVQY